MNTYFFDSSAIFKRYSPEVGTPWVRTITASASSNTIMVAQITSVEIASALMRRRREKQIKLATAYAIQRLIKRHLQTQYLVVQLTDDVVNYAESLLGRHALRAYDAVQLGSALEANERLINANLPPLIFVSADNRLTKAAGLEGLSTDDPNSHR